jgi:hypothetical protein
MITRIQADLKAAMIAKDSFRTGVLRMAIAAINNESIAKLGGIIDYEAVVKRLVKSRQDSVEQFAKVGMTDRALLEQAEIEILNCYLPKQLTDTELESAVQDAIEFTKATTRKEMGTVMALLKTSLGNTFDTKKASQLVTSRLA